MRVLTSLTALGLSASLLADGLEGKVVKVADGDTITSIIRARWVQASRTFRSLAVS